MTGLEQLRDRPVFICGHPKSGTSLVRAVLDSHPQLVVYPEETLFFRRFLPQAEDLDLEDQLELAERTIIHIFLWNMDDPPPDQDGFPDRDYSTISFQDVQRSMENIAKENYRHPGDILYASIIAYGQVNKQIGSGTVHWVEKSPYNEYYADMIFEFWLKQSNN